MLKHPFDITYLPNSCEAITDSFLPSNGQLTSEENARDTGVKFINFERKYEELNDFTLMRFLIWHHYQMKS